MVKQKCNNGISGSDLLYRVSIEEKTKTRGETHSMEVSWSEITGGAVGAAVDWTGGSEGEILTKETAKTNVTFTIRYLAGLTKEMRIVYDGDNFDILTILTVGRKKFMKIKTELIE